MAEFDFTSGTARIDLSHEDPADVEQREAAQLVVRDERRVRPRYHDGRFLTAADLTREQLYVLTRQADLAAARRGGVVRGLEVRRSGASLQVTAGSGFTPDGELVTLPRTLTVDVHAIPEDDRIDLSSGTVDVPEPPPRDRSGLYVLALRPLEYAARPLTRYPLSIHGTPGMEDGDLVEAVALTLHPYRFEGARDPAVLRSEVARTTFLARSGVLAPDALALAVVLLQGGFVRWIDAYLVRRDVAADDAGPLGLAELVRSQREAHFNQYDHHLRELVTELAPRNQLRFAATTYFRCLPPVGRMPAAAIDPATFTQAYFPPAMTIELGAVAEDELPGLVEDAVHLPPIDLVGEDEDFDHTRIRVLVPMPAARLDALRLTAVQPPKLLLLPAVLARRTPLLALKDLIARRRPPDPTDLVDETRPEPAPLLAAWRQALAGAADRMLWFVRVPAVASASVELFDEPDTDEDGIPDAKEEADAKAETDAKNATDTTAKNTADAKNAADGKNATDTKNSDDAAKAQRDAKAEADAKGQRDAKTDTDSKNTTDAKRVEDTKRETDAKNVRDTNEKNLADAKRDADNTKNERDAKLLRDNAKNAADAKRERDEKTDADTKTVRDAKELRDDEGPKRIRDTKELRDGGKELRDGGKELRDVRKPVREDVKRIEVGLPPRDILVQPSVPTDVLVQPTRPENPIPNPLRTFIRPEERPDLDTHILRKTRES